MLGSYKLVAETIGLAILLVRPTYCSVSLVSDLNHVTSGIDGIKLELV